MDSLARLKLRAGIEGSEKDPLLALLLEDAREFILSYTGRLVLPDRLVGAQVQLALVWLGRQGVEGDLRYSEGGISRNMEPLPEDLQRQLNPWRLARRVNLHGHSGAE